MRRCRVVWRSSRSRLLTLVLGLEGSAMRTEKKFSLFAQTG